jgi:hypothetical protein
MPKDDRSKVARNLVPLREYGIDLGRPFVSNPAGQKPLGASDEIQRQ